MKKYFVYFALSLSLCIIKSNSAMENTTPTTPPTPSTTVTVTPAVVVTATPEQTKVQELSKVTAGTLTSAKNFIQNTVPQFFKDLYEKHPTATTLVGVAAGATAVGLVLYTVCPWIKSAVRGMVGCNCKIQKKKKQRQACSVSI